MPDGLVRLHHSGQAHFLTFSCYHRLPLLAQMHMEGGFLRALELVRRRLQFCIFGYVVMPEHVHLLINEPGSGTIADVMRLLKAKVSVQARKEQKRCIGDDPFWQARYFDHNVRNHAGFVTQLRYIHRNPVKRGLCAKPEDWPWSSFRAWALGEKGPVEIENEWTARRRGLRGPEWSPTLSAEKSGKDGARKG
jgi:putative transposase